MKMHGLVQRGSFAIGIPEGKIAVHEVNAEMPEMPKNFKTAHACQLYDEHGNSRLSR